MIINDKNYQIGNKAIAAVLLLYYHLLNEKGFTNDQTIYIDPDDFDGFSFLDTTIKEEKMSLDIDQRFLREGAVIYLLCELNDMICEYDTDFLSQEFTQKIINALINKKATEVPEANSLVTLICTGEKSLNHSEFALSLEKIYKKYVVSRFQSFLR